MAVKGLRRIDYWNRVTGSVRAGDTKHEETVTDVESFLVPHAQIATAGLHLWGIADGLTITAIPNQSSLTISPGTAIDAAGHLIALAAGGLAVVDPNIDPNDIANIPTVAVDSSGVSLPTATHTGTRYLTIRHQEVGAEGLLGNAPTLVHAPWLRLLDTTGFDDAGTDVALARVDLTNGTVTALSANLRRLAGLPGETLQLRRPTATTGASLNIAHTPAAELRARPDGGVDFDMLNPANPRQSAFTVDPAGRVGIGIGAGEHAQRNLHVEASEVHCGGGPGGFSFADRSVGSFVETPDDGERWLWYAEAGTARLWSGADHLSVAPDGNIGIGINAREARRILHVEGTEIHSGGGIGGLSFADRNVGTFVESPTTGQRWVWFARDGVARLWSGHDILAVSAAGEGGGLDVSRRMRVRQGNDGSAGIWFFQTATGSDRAFVGMADDNRVGFWGNTGIGWGLTMNTSTGALDVAGFLDTRRRMRVRQGVDPSAGIWFFQNGPQGDRGFVGMADDTHIGFWGNTGAGWGVRMDTTTGQLEATGGRGLFQFAVVAKGNVGVLAEGAGAGIIASGNPAGSFFGDVRVTGTLFKGDVQFKIDHPLDPEHKFLHHGSIESDEMKNLYDGIADVDSDGRAEVVLPDWFEALNESYRYQLTPIGAQAPNLHIARELQNGRFTIAGAEPGTKVCWQVSGVRHDAYARAHPLQVEAVKSAEEAGLFVHPEEHNEPAERSLATLFQSAST